MNDKRFYIYGLFYEDEDGDNVCFYIGSGCRDRKDAHFYPSSLSSTGNLDKKEKIQNADNIHSVVLCNNLTRNQARELEEEVLKKDEVWENENITNKRKCISEANFKSPAWNKGKTYEECYGEKRAKKIKEKMSKSVKSSLTKEVKEKIGKSNTGKKNGMYGKTAWNNGKSLRKETKEKLAKSKGELNQNEVMEIKWLLKNTSMKQSEIGNLYEVGRKSVSNINTEKCWKFIQSTKLPCYIAVADYEGNV